MSKVSSTKLGWTELTGERSRYRGTNEIRFAYLQLFVKKKIKCFIRQYILFKESTLFFDILENS